MSVYGWLGLAMIVFYVGLILYIMLASAKCQPVEDFNQPEMPQRDDHAYSGHERL